MDFISKLEDENRKKVDAELTALANAEKARGDQEAQFRPYAEWLVPILRERIAEIELRLGLKIRIAEGPLLVSIEAPRPGGRFLGSSEYEYEVKFFPALDGNIQVRAIDDQRMPDRNPDLWPDDMSHGDYFGSVETIIDVTTTLNNLKSGDLDRLLEWLVRSARRENPEKPQLSSANQSQSKDAGGKGFTRPAAIAVGILGGFFFAKVMSIFVATIITNSGVRETQAFDMIAALWIGGSSILFGVMVTSILRRNTKDAWSSAIVLVLGLGIGRVVIGAASGTPGGVQPPVANGTPQITSVSNVSNQQSQTITITGYGFGTMTPYSGDSDYLRVSDVTKSWNAGWTKDPGTDKVTLLVKSWTDDAIVIGGFAGAYGSDPNSMGAGDQLEFQVWNPQTNVGPSEYYTFVAAAMTPSANSIEAPEITSVSPIFPEQLHAIVISGKGFGTRAPYSGNSEFIRFSDITKNWNAGSSRDFPPDKITLIVDSWTDTQIEISGFSGSYGDGDEYLSVGDTVGFQVWSTQNGPSVYHALVTPVESPH